MDGWMCRAGAGVVRREGKSGLAGWMDGWRWLLATLAMGLRHHRCLPKQTDRQTDRQIGCASKLQPTAATPFVAKGGREGTRPPRFSPRSVTTFFFSTPTPTTISAHVLSPPLFASLKPKQSRDRSLPPSLPPYQIPPAFLSTTPHRTTPTQPSSSPSPALQGSSSCRQGLPASPLKKSPHRGKSLAAWRA